MVFIFFYFFIPKVFITQVPFFFIFLIILDLHNHLKEGNCIGMHFLLVYLNFYCILPHLQLTFLKKYFQHLWKWFLYLILCYPHDQGSEIKLLDRQNYSHHNFSILHFLDNLQIRPKILNLCFYFTYLHFFLLINF